jgi:hypothetical protein
MKDLLNTIRFLYGSPSPLGKVGMGLLFFLFLIRFKTTAQQLLPFDKETKGNCLFQDSKQKIWIGSSKGLFSYDGLNFKPFLPQNNVTAIFEDRHKKLWIGYENGEIRTLNNKGETELWNIEEGLPKAKITGFAESPNGSFWFSTYGEGVYYYQDKHLYNVNQDDGLPSNEVYDIAFADAIWICTDGGASRIQLIDNQKVIKTLTTEDGLGDNIVTKVELQPRGIVFHCFEKEHGYRYEPYVHMPRITEESYDNVLMYQNEAIIDEIRYNDGSRWVLTSKKIWYHHPNFYKIETLPFKIQVQQEDYYDLYKGAFEGNYLGTSEGLYYQPYGINPKIKKIQLIANQKVSVSCISQNDTLVFIGTLSHGFFILDKKTQKVLRRISKKDGLSDEAVLSVSQNIFSTAGGLYEVNTQDFTFQDLAKKANIAIKYVYSIYQDAQKTIWLGTDGNGIIKIKSDFSLENITKINEKTLKTVYQIAGSYDDTKEQLFFATPDIGVVHYDSGKNTFEIYDKNVGLRSNNINSLSAFPDKLLVANEKGIDVLSLKGKFAFPLLHDDLENTYEPNLNLFDEFKNDIAVGNQIFHYEARNLVENNQPKVHFENIKLFNQAIDYQQDSVFSHTQNFFHFEWCGIYYPKPDALHFQYMLDGFDRDWNDTKERNVTYPRLPSGDYTFRVKALLGTYPSEEIRYHFTVKSAFWETPFFIISLLILSGLGIFYFIKLREKRLQKTAQLEQEKIIAQYDAIRSQVNPHFLFNTFNALAAVIETDQKQGVLFVEKLSDFFRNMLQHRDKETIPIGEESALLQDYIFILKKRFGENVIFNNQIQETEGNIVPLTLQILVENAVKHNVVSKSKPLYINILAKENYIIVENNLQAKPQPDNSTKFGLDGIVKRYALLTAHKVLIEKTSEKFVVKIPIL